MFVNTYALYYREYGQPSDSRPALVFLHGLFGSSVNWHGIVRQLQDRYRVICPDLRNHGRSPHAASMDYPAMSGDVLRLLDQLQLEQVAVIGHSMGAKVAMWLALQHPERVDRLLAADMAPVRYANRFATIISALQALDTGRLNSRAEAQTRLLDRLGNPALVNYLLQNLAFRDDRYYWRINLEVVSEQIHTLMDFPPLSGQQQFPGPACFVYAERSDYVDQTAMQRIMALFPHARMRMMAATGHWLYAEKPEEFMQILMECLR